MKIIVLMGSPRKKDSYNMCKLIEANLSKSCTTEFEYIFLKVSLDF
jgi:multimeric flavodoxin WrbA